MGQTQAHEGPNAASCRVAACLLWLQGSTPKALQTGSVTSMARDLRSGTYKLAMHKMHPLHLTLSALFLVDVERSHPALPGRQVWCYVEDKAHPCRLPIAALLLDQETACGAHAELASCQAGVQGTLAMLASACPAPSGGEAQTANLLQPPREALCCRHKGALTPLEPGRPALEPVGHVLHPFLQPRRQALPSQGLPSLCCQRPLPHSCGRSQEGHGADDAMGLVLEGCLHKHQGGCLAGKVQGPCRQPEIGAVGM